MASKLLSYFVDIVYTEKNSAYVVRRVDDRIISLPIELCQFCTKTKSRQLQDVGEHVYWFIPNFFTKAKNILGKIFGKKDSE